MREWILENTNVTEEEYDYLINPTTVTFKGISNDLTKVPLTNHPIINIDLFTLKEPTPDRILKYNIHKQDDYYIYQNIKFRILAEYLNTLKTELYNIERLGTCFFINSKICLMTKKSRIVTAICQDIFHQEGKAFLHTFVIVTSEKDNQEYVLDGTMNTIIEKETYFKLFDVKIISDIPKKEFYHIINLFSSSKIDKEISLIEYLCFPEQTKKSVLRLTKRKK